MAGWMESLYGANFFSAVTTCKRLITVLHVTCEKKRKDLVEIEKKYF